MRRPTATGRTPWAPAPARLPVGSRGDAKAVTGPPQATLGGYTVTATNPGRPKPVSVEVFDPHGDGMGEDMFTLNVLVDGKVVENYDNVSTKEGDAYVVTRTAASKLIRIEATAPDAPLVKVARGAVELVAPEPEPVGPAADALGADDYVGDVAARTGFSGLEAVEEVTIVAVPDLVAALEHGAITEETFKAVQLGIITHCELMGDRVAILDPPPGKNPQEILKWRVTDAAYDSKFATMYWPYVKVFDPTSGTTTFVPPSGHVAGVWARNDDTRGVHKAPANEVIRGAVSLATQITKAEHDLLNPVGINCIRAFPGRGVRVWGARTLSSDPAWRYLNVRRLFNYLEESILMGTQWVVFEPNDHAALGPDPAHHQRLPRQRVAQGRALRHHPGRGVLRQVRRRDQPGGGHRRRPGRLPGRGRPGQAGRVRHLPAVAVLRRRLPGQRVTNPKEPHHGASRPTRLRCCPRIPVHPRRRRGAEGHRGVRPHQRGRQDRDEAADQGRQVRHPQPHRPAQGRVDSR